MRFFVNKTDIYDNTIRLNAEDANHIRSLRLRPDELFTVCDGEGSDYICRLGERSSGSTAEIIRTCESQGEPDIKCSVYIALAKGDRLDYAVQKSIELGAHEVIIFPSRRCIIAPGDINKKISRLQKIALQTAMQCGRGIVPNITAARSFTEAIAQALQAELPLFFYEDEENMHLKQALDKHDRVGTISLVTGPEGGFEPNEAERAVIAGMTSVSLGPRILRCETAPVAALAAIMYHTGNL